MHMLQQDIETKPGCILSAMNILGEKWTALLLRDLTAGAQTFGDLEKSIDGINPRTLSQRLEKLQAEGIVDKLMYCEHPPRYQYALTQKGRDLHDVLVQMAAWGEKYQMSCE